ncbi:protein RRP5 homolog [Lepeophtheirus salmonis]|uniref:protein RRP5 homolog n=1 Tax=Lepeophtheirus salmonis TaxID=72036 RepID=UPI001AE28726|nr:protein RRP5 homolog [Lepeophtheirus salmonis]
MSIEEEKSFPRGGVVSINKKRKRVEGEAEEREVKDFPSKKKKNAQSQNLFGNSSGGDEKVGKSKTKGNKKKNKSTKSSNAEDKKEDDSEIKVVHVGGLTYSTLSPGMKVLGVVYSVEQYQVKLSLPGYLSASLPITKISKIYNDLLVQIAQKSSSDELRVPQLEDMLPKGTVLPITISSVDKTEEGRYIVKVSAEPDLNLISLNHLNIGTRLSGIISSVQDHGYIVDIGLNGVRAFLKSKKEKLVVGQIIYANVSAKDEVANTVSLSLKKKSVVVNPSSLHSLIPGMRINVQFKKKLKGGFSVSFGDLEGIVPFPHYAVDQEFVEGEELEASVLYVAPIVNTVYLSLKENVFTGGVNTLINPVKTGELVQNCTVLSVSPKGIFLKKVIKGEKMIIFVNPFEALDGPKNLNILKSTYPLKSKVKLVRLIQLDMMSLVYIGSLKKDMIDNGLISPKSLNVGDHVVAKIKAFKEKGVCVVLGRLNGFIRNMHLTSIPLKNPELKFTAGSKIKCRVLTLPGANNKKGITLTAKPVLVKTEYTIVDSYDPKFLNIETKGMVVQVKNNGLLIELFGGTKGWVTKDEVSSDPVEYIDKMFHPGQVLKCKVKKIDEQKEKMVLSLRLLNNNKPKSKKEIAKMSLLNIGGKYSCRVTSVDPNGLSVQVIQGKGVDKTVSGFIPTNHLTDNIFLANCIKQSYSVGDEIKEALFLMHDAIPVLTLKRSFLSYDASSINSFEDIHLGLVVPAVVDKIHKIGPSVTFPVTKSTMKTETIPLRSLADFFIEDINDILSVHSSILIKIIDKKEEDKSLVISSKMSVLSINEEVSLVLGLIEEIKLIRKGVKGPLKSYEPGMVLSAKFVERNGFGIMVSVGKTRGVITNTNLHNDFDEQSPIPVVVLFVDYEMDVLELTNKIDIVSDLTLVKEKPLRVDQYVQAKPIWSRDEFHYVLMMVVSPVKYKGRLLKVASRRNINDWKGKFDELSIEKTYNVQIKDRIDAIAVIDDPKLQKIKDKIRKRKADKNVDTTILKKIKIPEPKIQEVVEPSAVNEVHQMSIDVEDENFNPWGEGPLLKSVDDSNDTDEAKKKKTHLSKSEAKALTKLEKEEIRKTEELVINGEEIEPKSVDDFEKIVLANPDSSLHWIQYIAFHANKGEMKEARLIIKRAIEKIHFREEEERLNVYIAWFNLEESISSEDEVETLLKEILKYNNEYKVYNRVSLIYSQSGKIKKAEELYKTMARKYGKEIEVWSKLGRHYFESVKNLKEARFTLQRALQHLDKKHHVEVTVKFAQMEFKYGEIERGKTIFETILSNYPKRIDLWNVYADTLVKAEEIQATRDLFERMITLNLQPKKMKAIFKKYIDFETLQNDDFKVDRIKKKALEYVESKVGALDTD